MGFGLLVDWSSYVVTLRESQFYTQTRKWCGLQFFESGMRNSQVLNCQLPKYGTVCVCSYLVLSSTSWHLCHFWSCIFCFSTGGFSVALWKTNYMWQVNKAIRIVFLINCKILWVKIEVCVDGLSSELSLPFV